MQPTPYQTRALLVPDTVRCVVHAGGRAGGKTVAGFMGMEQHARRHGPLASVVYARKTFPSLKEPWSRFCEFLSARGLTPSQKNLSDMTLTVSGAPIRFLPLENDDHYRRTWQGASITHMLIDELSAYHDPSLIDRAISNLRSPSVPTRLVLATNPGPGTPWIVRRFLDQAASLQPGEPFIAKETGLLTVVLRSSIDDNPHLGQQDRDNLMAATGGSAALKRMYLEGDFSAQESLFFVLTESNFVALPHFRFSDEWVLCASADHGTAAPFSYLLAARARTDATAPDGSQFPRGSTIIFGETHSADQNVGYARAARQVTVADIASQIHALHERLHAAMPSCNLDAATFANTGAGTIADQYKAYGVPVVAGVKGARSQGWVLLKEHLSRAASVGSRLLPGLYFAAGRVPYLQTAIQNAPMHPFDPNDIEDGYALDHPLDALRYLLNSMATARGTAARTFSIGPLPWEESRFEAYRARKKHEEYVSASRQFVMGRCRRKFDQ